MLIASSNVLREAYLLPAIDIFQDIEQKTRKTVILPKPDRVDVSSEPIEVDTPKLSRQSIQGYMRDDQAQVSSRDLGVERHSDTCMKLRKPVKPPNSTFSDAKDYAYWARRLERLHGERQFHELAEFLGGPWNSETKNRSSQRREGPEDEIGEGLITTYDFSPTERFRKHEIRSFKQVKSEACSPFTLEQSGRLVFLRGHQSARWLSHICGHYNVDPEFLRKHIEFTSVRNRWRNFERPAWSPISSNIIHTTITVVGHRHSGLDPLNPKDREKVHT